MDENPKRWPDRLLEAIPLPDPLGAVSVGLAIALAVIVAAALDGLPARFWPRRVLPALFPIIHVVYGLVAYRYVNRVVARAVVDLRPAVEASDEQYQSTVAGLPARNDLLPVVLGVLFGLLMGRRGPPLEGPASQMVRVLMLTLQWIVLFWLVYWAIGVGLRLVRLHRFSFRINVFDPTPLEPIALVSLSMAMIFVGQVTIVLLSTMRRGLELPHSMQRLVLLVIMLGVAAAVFLLPMLHTHRKMADAKEAELVRIRMALLDTYRDLHDRKDRGELAGMEELADTITAFLSYEKRVDEAPEWPITSDTWQQLAASTVAPVGAWLYEAVLDPLFFG